MCEHPPLYVICNTIVSTITWVLCIPNCQMLLCVAVYGMRQLLCGCVVYVTMSSQCVWVPVIAQQYKWAPFSVATVRQCRLILLTWVQIIFRFEERCSGLRSQLCNDGGISIYFSAKVSSRFLWTLAPLSWMVLRPCQSWSTQLYIIRKETEDKTVSFTSDYSKACAFI